jgi:hypothetical protein
VTGDRTLPDGQAIQLTGPDKRALLLWVVLGIVGSLFAHKYFFRAFPEASVNFQVSREEALARAQKFVGGLGENVGGYRSAIVFNVDDNAKVYLERELGLQQANHLMSSELNIWFWDVRFFRPQQEEEFQVRVNPAGEIVGYHHKVEEARSGATLERSTAQSIAQGFLEGARGLHLDAWDLLPEEVNSSKRPNRLDWSFTWEKHGFRAKEAPYRLQVSLEGNHIGGSGEFLKVPETWERGYARLRSGNDTLALVFTVPYLLLLGAAVWLALTLTKRGQTSWRGPLVLGMVVATALFLQNLNDWPHWSAGYNTNDSYGSFLASKLAVALLISVLSALTVSLVLPSAEPLYRASQPGRLRLSEVLTLRGLRSKEFFSAAVVGLSMAAAHIGYIVAFYIVAGHFGAWAPQELNYDESVNTAFPWISGAAIGLLASTNEEFTFRLFAIPFFSRLTRSRWIAVFVPAFLWSFLHSNYPQEPAYIRGIEIGIIGIVAGMVMLRWGIIATLIWHYTVDAALVGLLLIRSNSLYFKVSGIVVGAAALAPLVFAGISYWARGRFEADEDLLNRANPLPQVDFRSTATVADAEAISGRYDALASGTIGFLALGLLFGGVLVWRLKPQTIGDYLRLSVDARTARIRADEVLRQRGLNPISYYHATVLFDVTDPVTNEYLRQRLGVAGVNDLYAKRVPGALWRVRYFRDSQPEEYAVVLKPDGSLHSLHHTIAEDTPGASLSKEEAVARAERFLREEKKIDLTAWTLVEANSEKRPHRIDHTLTWQQIAPLETTPDSASDAPDHAHARTDLQILGDEVTNYRTYIKIPDGWRRKQRELTLFRAVLSYGIPVLFLGGLGLTELIVFLSNLRSDAARAIPWKRIALWSIWGIACYLLVFAVGNRIPAFLSAYETAIPFKMMLGGMAIGALLGGPLYFGGIALLFGMAWYFATRAFGQDHLPGWGGMPAAYYRDALWIGLGGSAGLLGLNRLLETALAHWPSVHRTAEASFGKDFDAILPAASILGGTVLRGLFLTGVVAAIAAFLTAQIRQPWRRLLLLPIGAFALVGGNWGSPTDFAKQFVARFVLCGVLVLGVRYIMRFNLLGCFLVIASTSLVGGATELLTQPDEFYRANGYAVLILVALLLSWPLASWRLGRAQNTA